MVYWAWCVVSAALGGLLTLLVFHLFTLDNEHWYDQDDIVDVLEDSEDIDIYR